MSRIPWAYVGRRVLAAIPTMLAIITVAFFMMRAAPGNPYSTERKLTPAVEANLKRSLGLDKSVPEQYFEYLGKVVRGDLGPSMQVYDKSVSQLLGEGLPVSLTIGGLAITIGVFFGVMLGVIAAMRQNSAADYTAMSIAMVGISIPTFVTGPLLSFFFGVYLHWFKAGGLDLGKMTFHNIFLPVITLALPQIAIISRLMRASMIEVLRSNNIRTARAKGLSEVRILLRHAAPAAILPVVSYLGPAFVGVITGSVVIESVFGLPGVGASFIEGAVTRDYTRVMGAVILYGGLIILFNLLADILYAILDPKVRFNDAKNMIGVAAPGENAALMNKAAIKGRSLWDDSRRRLLSNKAAVAGFILLALLTLLAIVGPFVWPHDYANQYKVFIDGREAPLIVGPTLDQMHWLGTDSFGRDMVARVLTGLRISLAVGFVATLVSLVIGVAWGAIAGFAGGRTDQIMMRFVDVLYAVPFIFFVILVTVVFGRSIFLIFLAIGAVEWMTMARIVRGQTLMLKQKEFVEAARAAGVKPMQLVIRHILPNLLGPVAVYVTLPMPVVILQESFLSFIGLGVNEPLTSLGRLISEGQREFAYPWMLLVPAVTMVVTLFSLNFIGDGLRDAFDPKDR